MLLFHHGMATQHNYSTQSEVIQYPRMHHQGQAHTSVLLLAAALEHLVAGVPPRPTHCSDCSGQAWAVVHVGVAGWCSSLLLTCG